jgi:hypothetical protein
MSEEQAPTEASFSLETLTHALELLGDMPQLRLDSPVFLWSASHISFVSLNWKSRCPAYTCKVLALTFLVAEGLGDWEPLRLLRARELAPSLPACMTQLRYYWPPVWPLVSFHPSWDQKRESTAPRSSHGCVATALLMMRAVPTLFLCRLGCIFKPPQLSAGSSWRWPKLYSDTKLKCRSQR